MAPYCAGLFFQNMARAGGFDFYFLNKCSNFILRRATSEPCMIEGLFFEKDSLKAKLFAISPHIFLKPPLPLYYGPRDADS